MRALDLRAVLWLVAGWLAVLTAALVVVGDPLPAACAAALALGAVLAARVARAHRQSPGGHRIDWDAFDVARRAWGERLSHR